MNMPSPTIGIVGLGLVGQALGLRLRAAGWRTLGHDLRPEAVQAFEAAGGEGAGSLPALGRSVDTVVLAVFDTHGALQVLEGEPGLLGPGSRVGLVIDCSTGSPDLLVALGRRLHARGIDLVEAPLSGSSQQIGEGEATALVGADDAGVARAAPVLSALASRWIHVGAPGMGAKAKLATNLVLGLNRAVFAEGLAFAQSLGLDPRRFLELVLASPASSEAARIKGPLMVEGDFAPRSRIRQHLKDVRLMLDSAGAAALELPFSRVHAQLLEEAVAQGEGELDNAAILLRLRGRAPRP
ncbi:NAD(P)-dependent oxidoreductase [Variovorax sp. J31P207]|uniref:NAD(P)-dependent oxidoreductase n=1 Tax=Variovorax sp. J31P207 TaxID=3053510 RepID=UPI002575228F|nr:NAD(P)-dependent oxidoreductase [Variovorax sp. J31P207]MDM0067288.1 NAD(P)-dependent oxidoreductase [Variovorax sp. J31P207]